jgi:hypothetical protein
MNTFEIVQQPADRLSGDVAATLFFEDQRPLVGPAAVLDWRLDGQLTKTLLEGRLSGRAGEHVLYQNNAKLAADWALFIGGGKWGGLCAETYAALVRHLLSVACDAGFRHLSLCLPLPEELDLSGMAGLVKQELENNRYQFDACRLSTVDSLTG